MHLLLAYLKVADERICNESLSDTKVYLEFAQAYQLFLQGHLAFLLEEKEAADLIYQVCNISVHSHGILSRSYFALLLLRLYDLIVEFLALLVKVLISRD